MKHPLELACKALAGIFAGRQAQAILQAILDTVPRQQRPAITDLVYGVLRYHILLQGLLSEVLRSPATLPARMLMAMELALYALLFQNDSPPYAIINEAVSFIKKEFGQKMANVGNAVLRNISRSAKIGLDLASLPVSQQLSLPSGLYQLWANNYGQEAAHKLATRTLIRPYAGYRINLAKADEKFITALRALPGAYPMGRAAIAFSPGQFPADILDHPVDYWLKKGFLSRQATGSMKILEELKIVSNWLNKPVWDACAGVGGKTLALLEAGLNVTLASDVNPGRVAFLGRECERLGIASPPLAVINAAQPPLREWAGNILVDAPCSGTGVLARRPDIKLRWSTERTRELVQLQRQILAALAAVIHPGHELCYITCALNPDENERQIEWLFAACPDLKLVREWQTPHNHPWLEGMYGARLIKSV